MSDNAADKVKGSYKMGMSCLLSGKPYESLSFYAKAIQISLNERVIEAALNSIDKLTVHSQLLGFDWVRKLLLIGLAAKFPTTDAGKATFEQVKKIASTPYQPLENPVVIVAGGCSSEVEAQMRTYQGLIFEAFHDFKGTIISGGTTSGISGLVGEAQQKYPNTIRSVGYVPKTKTDLMDKRYSEIRFTDGEKFSPIEPLQYWVDIITSGNTPSGVKLLGINGGRISALEYRVALALGAHVAIVRGSGLEADKLLSDNEWNSSGNLVTVPNDSMSVWAFIRGDKEP